MTRGSKTLSWFVVSVFAFTSAGLALGQGSIRYVPNANMSFGPFDQTTPWDVNGDGDADFIFQTDIRSFTLLPKPGNAVVALPAIPPDLGASLTPLLPGVEIGALNYSPHQWVSSALDRDGFPIGVHINFCSTQGCIGSFWGVDAHFAFQFQANGQAHYGWAFLSTQGAPGGNLVEFAYQSTPSAHIFTGQVPEPSAWVLLTGGLLAGWIAFRRRG